MDRQRSRLITGHIQAGFETSTGQRFMWGRGIGACTLTRPNNLLRFYAQPILQLFEYLERLYAKRPRHAHQAEETSIVFIGLGPSVAHDPQDADEIDRSGQLTPASSSPSGQVAGLNLAKYRAYCMVDRTEEEAGHVESIGQRLRLLRQTFQISRPQMARLLDCDIELLTAIENGFGDLGHALLLIENLEMLCNTETE